MWFEMSIGAAAVLPLVAIAYLIGRYRKRTSYQTAEYRGDQAGSERGEREGRKDAEREMLSIFRRIIGASELKRFDTDGLEATYNDTVSLARDGSKTKRMTKTVKVQPWSYDPLRELKEARDNLRDDTPERKASPARWDFSNSGN